MISNLTETKSILRTYDSLDIGTLHHFNLYFLIDVAFETTSFIFNYDFKILQTKRRHAIIYWIVKMTRKFFEKTRSEWLF